MTLRKGVGDLPDARGKTVSLHTDLIEIQPWCASFPSRLLGTNQMKKEDAGGVLI